MIRKRLTLARVIAFCAPLVLVVSCGSPGGANQGSTVAIDPNSKTWTVLAFSPITVLGQPALIAIRDPNGAAQPGVSLTLSLDLSLGTTTPGSEVMALYVDEDGDGVFETGPVTSPYTTTANSYGQKAVRVDMVTGGLLSYKGILHAYTGSALGTADFEVKCDPGSFVPAPC